MKKIFTYIPDILLWVFPLLLIVPNVILDFTEQYYSFPARLTNALLPLGIYMLLMALSRKTGRTVLLFIPIMILCAFQIVLIYLYGESIIAIDMFLNVVTTNCHEAGELLQNLLMAIVVVCLLYLPPIIMGIILCAKRLYASAANRRRVGVVGMVSALLGVVTLVCAFFMPDGYKPSRELFPVNVCCNMGMAGYRTALTEEYAETSADFTFGATATTDSVPEVIVFVIGETSRAGNWQLNGYDRPTNPRLSSRSGLISFSKALSESNTTHKSVPLLMSHLGADNFGDSIYNVKSVIAAFGEAGFRTAWLSNQQHNGSLIDFFGMEADRCKFLVDDEDVHFDMDLCPELEDFLTANEDKPVFAVLHTYGSHFNYKERYPDEFARFLPDEDMQADKANRQQLINAYDNSILYVDAMLDSVAAVLENCGRPAAMLYIADHGEDIFDDSRERFLHASPTPTYTQLHVPVVLWLSDSYAERHPECLQNACSNAGRNISSSHSAFNTLVSLGGISTPFCEPTSSLVSDTYTEPRRVYLNDYNEGIPLSRAGMRKPDFAALDSAGIAVR